MQKSECEVLEVMRAEPWPELSCCMVVTVMEHAQLPGKSAMDGSCKKCQLQRPLSAQRCLHKLPPSWLSRRQLNVVSMYLIRTKPCGKMVALNVYSWGYCKEEGMSLSESIIITPERRSPPFPLFLSYEGKARSICLGVRRSERLPGGEPLATVFLLRYPCASNCGGHSFSIL